MSGPDIPETEQLIERALRHSMDEREADVDVDLARLSENPKALFAATCSWARAIGKIVSPDATMRISVERIPGCDEDEDPDDEENILNAAAMVAAVTNDDRAGVLALWRSLEPAETVGAARAVLGLCTVAMRDD